MVLSLLFVDGSDVDSANASTDDVKPPSFRSKLEKLSAEAEKGMESSDEDASRDEPALLPIGALARNSLAFPFLGEINPPPHPPPALLP